MQAPGAPSLQPPSLYLGEDRKAEGVGERTQGSPRCLSTSAFLLLAPNTAVSLKAPLHASKASQDEPLAFLSMFLCIVTYFTYNSSQAHKGFF